MMTQFLLQLCAHLGSVLRQLCETAARVSPHQLVQLARGSFAQLPQHRSEMSTQLQQELRHHGCTQCIAIVGRECHNCSVVSWRSRISTGYSQPITAYLSAGCKSSIHANST